MNSFPRKKKTSKPYFTRPALSMDELANQFGKLGINPRPVPPPNAEPVPILRFEDMNLHHNLLKGLLSYGYTKPAIIQQKAIVAGIHGYDLILQAQSGMGKTAAMVTIVLQRIKVNDPRCQAIILAPTRELALQIHEVVSQLGKYLNVRSMVCIGGRGNSTNQRLVLKHGGVHVIVGTLGRLRNMLSTPPDIEPKNIQMFVIDEADKMLLDGSFRHDVKALFNKINGSAQIILMSATMPEAAIKYAYQVTVNPIKISLSNYALTLEGIKQFYVNVGDDDKVKLQTLYELLQIILACGKHTLIFSKTRARVNEICKNVNGRNYKVKSIEGIREQAEREKLLKEFKFTSENIVLIATDLLGRGIDVQQVFLVINYDFPTKIEDYIHRVGRGGRYGRNGLAITFVKDKELPVFAKLQEFYHTQILEMPSNIIDYMR